MIARIAPEDALAAPYLAFLDALRVSGFTGDIETDHAARTVMSTDNSIYQRTPQAAIYPRDTQDLQRIARLMAEAAHRQVVLAPRGGGTGTNGQSLTDGIIVDVSRHMNRILDIDTQTRRVRVQAGVVKDQLNAALRPHGLFFAPELSTSNRATIGGMISTDASGQGSCTYGKTRNHVLALDTVLLGGELHHSESMDEAAFDALAARQDRVGIIYRTVGRIARTRAAEIEAKFPKLNRCLTGYDLAHIVEDGQYNLNSVLCGSEGSLGFLAEATLNVLPIPKHSVLINIRYTSFMDALRDAQALMGHNPLSIETVDSRVLMLAMQDIVWHGVAEYFPGDASTPTLGINLVEFSGDDPDDVQARVDAFVTHLQADTSVRRIGHTLARGSAAISKIYAMRKRAVGLLGNVQGEARPQPFVEDTAVPPEHLADFIAEFRALLDGHGLQYGMFGHVDAGVLHVRPALDMKDPAQAALIRPISDAVAALTQRYGGLLWGEHGKGVRSEYTPAFFGTLYDALQDVKAAFDPHNQLNPGKIATPRDSGTPLLRIDAVPLRGDADRTIDERVWQSYESAVHCNGNGACYNYDPDDAMCPSWKATRDRVHSPKGRASLVREWLRLQGDAGVDVLNDAQRARRPGLRDWTQRARNSWRRARGGETDFSHQVYDAMSGCLACKSCAGQCPVKVNVPEFRSRFLELYHGRYLRPMKDYLIGSLEFTIPTLARAPGLYNGVMRRSLVRSLLARHAGMVDSPEIATEDFASALERHNVLPATRYTLAALSEAERSRVVVLVQDAFTRYFETRLAMDWIALATRLGYRVMLAPFLPNGKPLQVQGFLGAFEKAARRNAAHLSALAQYGVPLVGLDPAMTLVYRQEYAKLMGADAPTVMLPQEWLLKAASSSAASARSSAADAESTQSAAPIPEASANKPQAGRAPKAYRLLAHCTEKTNYPSAVTQWQSVFEQHGLTLSVTASGCCGMSGTYGHETRNVDTSKVIFSQSWGPIVAADTNEATLVADGYSCRSQVDRLAGKHLPHPLQVLLRHLESGA
ncbi:MAG: FAD-binding and (Fe-S)-binding domain-containing protein [Burkholderiaceae bacterium]